MKLIVKYADDSKQIVLMPITTSLCMLETNFALKKPSVVVLNDDKSEVKPNVLCRLLFESEKPIDFLEMFSIQLVADSPTYMFCRYEWLIKSLAIALHKFERYHPNAKLIEYLFASKKMNPNTVVVQQLVLFFVEKKLLKAMLFDVYLFVHRTGGADELYSFVSEPVAEGIVVYEEKSNAIGMFGQQGSFAIYYEPERMCVFENELITLNDYFNGGGSFD